MELVKILEGLGESKEDEGMINYRFFFVYEENTLLKMVRIFKKKWKGWVMVFMTTFCNWSLPVSCESRDILVELVKLLEGLGESKEDDGKLIDLP